MNQDASMNYSRGFQFNPQEKLYETNKSKSCLKIGIPKETEHEENRIAIVPQAAGLLVQNGHEVLIEKGAGDKAHFPDNKYSEQGAQILYSREDVFKADIILKVAPMTIDEIKLIKQGQIIFSAMQFSIQHEEYFRTLMQKKVTAIGYENIMDKTGSYPLVRAISEIVGNTSILIASKYLSSFEYGKGLMFGGTTGITPTEVVIIGAGTVGEYAAKAAIGLGAYVKVFDNSVYKLRRLGYNLHEHVFTSIIQPKVLSKALSTADVVIGALYSYEGMTPVIITEEMVSHMKYGSVIIDVSIDQGGCIETSKVTTHANPVYSVYGVTHYCVPNISSIVPHTASYAVSNFIAPIIISLAEKNGLDNLMREDYGIRRGAYIYKGILCNKTVGNYYNISYQDIDLLMAAFH